MSIQSQIASINRYGRTTKALLRKYGDGEFTAKQFAEIWGPVNNFNYKNYGLGDFEKIFKWKEMYDFAFIPTENMSVKEKVFLKDIVIGTSRQITGINTPYRDENGNPVHYQYPMLIEHIHSTEYTDPIGETFYHYYCTYSLNPEFCGALKEIKSQLKEFAKRQILRKLEKMQKEYEKTKQLATDFDIEECLEAFNI